MKKEKKKFIEDFIEQLNNQIALVNQGDSESYEYEERELFDLVISIAKVFSQELPELRDELILRNGSSITDASLLINKLELYIINNNDYVDSNVEDNKMEEFLIDDSFLNYASSILADTKKGLSGTKIVELCNSFAIDYRVKIPISSPDFGDFGSKVPNKRTALYLNLQSFSPEQQFQIISKLCDLSFFNGNDEVKDLKIKLYTNYGVLASEKIGQSELIINTRHWLENYPKALEQYNNSLNKFEGNIFERNTLDDMRLSFELLVKELLGNTKSLENNIDELGKNLKNHDISPELRNIFNKIIKYYTEFHNHYVKHDDKINNQEIEFIIEISSIIMKFLIKILDMEK